MFEWERKTLDYVNNKDIYNKLKLYVNLIIEKNKHFNLTGFNEEQIWLDGIYQSIVLLDKSIKNENNINLLDIGAGVGFPSIPYYIFKNDQIYLTIYEPIKKRVDFLNLVKEKLNLKNIKIVNKRIEDEVDVLNSNFVCARAVMPLKMLIEVSSKCFNIGTKYIFLKSKDANIEVNDSSWIINKLSIKNIEVNNIDLNDGKIHNVVTYLKTSNTPINFPRKWSEIKKENKK